jgi:hypothetical protein
MTDRLDQLLQAPLPEIADHGFSRKVMMRVEAEQRGGSIVTIIVTAICAVAVILFLPLPEITTMVRAISTLALQPWLYIAAAVVVLSLLVERDVIQV